MGLFDLTEYSDSFENEVKKKVASEIEYQNKRYIVKFPWKLDKEQFNDNQKIAESRFLRLKKKFYWNLKLYSEYRNVLQNYLNEGIIEPSNENSDCVSFYLPHREVIKRGNITSKLRIVFDASYHDSNLLNDCLHIGSNLYEDIFHILLWFGFHYVAFTADIKQAFLQIVINEKDRDVTHFLFTEDPFNDSHSASVFRFSRGLFGLNCSPFLLAATIKHHLRKYEIYLDTVKFLNENIYIDDLIGSHPSIENTLARSLESINIFQNARYGTA